MKGYKLMETDATKLVGKQMSDGVFFNPIKDKNDDYFIFEGEKTEAEILLGVELISFEFVPKEFQL